MKDLVSVVIPALNRPDLVKVTVSSVLAQTYQNVEAIIVDNGSEPPLSSQEFAEISRDGESPQARVVQHRHGNANAARNRGLDESKGSFILFLDSDDILEPNCIAGRLEDSERLARNAGVVGRCEYFENTPGDMPKRYWGDWNQPISDLEAFLGLGKDPWQTAGPLWRKEVLDATGLRWDESVDKAQDWEFHTRALSAGLVFHKRTRVDHYWRCRPNSGQMSATAHQTRALREGRLLRTLGLMFSNAIAAGYLTSTASSRVNLRRRGMFAFFAGTLRDSRNAGLSWKRCVKFIHQQRELGVVNLVTTAELATFLVAWDHPFLGRAGRSFFHRRLCGEWKVSLPQ